MKKRKVPLAFKEKVEDELDRLEKSGIITNASAADAEWGTPLGPVLKKDVLKKKLSMNFEVGEVVFARDYRLPNTIAWMKAIITKRLGMVLYECKTEFGIVKRRSHQLKKHPIEFFDDEQTSGNVLTEEDPRNVLTEEEPPIENSTYYTRYGRAVRKPRN